MKPIVVGVDGSEGSKRALAWAAGEARLRGAPMRVIHAWHPALVPGFPLMPMSNETEVVEKAAHEVLDEMVDAIDASNLVAPIERKVVLAGAATALLTNAGDAELLVVGARGLGGFLGLLLGSVTTQVIHHAPCPVVVVRA